MDELVQINKNQVVTSSLTVSEIFNKRHDNVMRDINNLKANMPDEKDVLSFEEMFQSSQTPDNYGRMHNMYYMTKNGLIFLVMGYRGKQANLIKLRYIKAFDVMQSELRNRWKISVDPEQTDNRLYTTSSIANQFEMSAYDVHQKLIKAGLIEYNSYLNCYVITDYYRNQNLAKLVNYHDNRNHTDVKWLKWTRDGRIKVQQILEYVGCKTVGLNNLDELHLEDLKQKGVFIMTNEHKNEEEPKKSALNYDQLVKQRYNKIMELPDNDWNNLMKNNASGLLRRVKDDEKDDEK